MPRLLRMSLLIFGVVFLSGCNDFELAWSHPYTYRMGSCDSNGKCTVQWNNGLGWETVTGVDPYGNTRNVVFKNRQDAEYWVIKSNEELGVHTIKDN